jgi:hypothetical protein
MMCRSVLRRLGAQASTAYVAFVAMSAVGCTTVRIDGTVTDRETGQLVTSCGVSLGMGYSNCDEHGRYMVEGHKSHPAMEIVTPGYETAFVPVPVGNLQHTINVQLTPKRRTRTDAE